MSGCATSPLPPGADGTWYSGRIAVRIEAAASAPARALSAMFELGGSASGGHLHLSTPIGTTIARIRWSDREAWLATPERETRHADVDALSREVLGENVPLPALFDWLRGRPWAGATSHPDGNGFIQQGWRVDLTQLAGGRLSVQRDGPPTVSLRVILDPR